MKQGKKGTQENRMKDGGARGGAAARGGKKRRDMSKANHHGRGSAGRANRREGWRQKEVRLRAAVQRLASMAEISRACDEFFRRRGMPVYGMREMIGADCGA